MAGGPPMYGSSVPSLFEGPADIVDAEVIKEKLETVIESQERIEGILESIQAEMDAWKRLPTTIDMVSPGAIRIGGTNGDE